MNHFYKRHRYPSEIISHCIWLYYTFPLSYRDRRRLSALVRSSQTIICDPASTPLVEQAIQIAREDLIRKPKVLPCKNYISEKSLALLCRELDLE